MPHTHDLVVFLLASLALLIVPGPAVVYIVARSIDRGRAAGIISALGLAAGSVVLVAAAAFGVSALLATSPRAFDAVRTLGAGYLAYLGLRTAFSKGAADEPAGGDGQPLRRVFAEGIVVNLLNPKTALFFFAFLPQFVNPEGGVRTQIFLLGLTFSAMGMVTDSVYATLGGAVAGRLRTDPRFPRARRAAVATTYLALAVLALLARPTK
jgi:threonine/homoserine/homoserine lactone efflux protein